MTLTNKGFLNAPKSAFSRGGSGTPNTNPEDCFQTGDLIPTANTEVVYGDEFSHFDLKWSTSVHEDMNSAAVSVDPNSGDVYYCCTKGNVRGHDKLNGEVIYQGTFNQRSPNLTDEDVIEGVSNFAVTKNYFVLFDGFQSNHPLYVYDRISKELVGSINFETVDPLNERPPADNSSNYDATLAKIYSIEEDKIVISYISDLNYYKRYNTLICFDVKNMEMLWRVDRSQLSEIVLDPTIVIKNKRIYFIEADLDGRGYIANIDFNGEDKNRLENIEFSIAYKERQTGLLIEGEGENFCLLHIDLEKQFAIVSYDNFMGKTWEEIGMEGGEPILCKIHFDGRVEEYSFGIINIEIHSYSPIESNSLFISQRRPNFDGTLFLRLEMDTMQIKQRLVFDHEHMLGYEDKSGVYVTLFKESSPIDLLQLQKQYKPIAYKLTKNKGE